MILEIGIYGRGTSPLNVDVLTSSVLGTAGDDLDYVLSWDRNPS